MNHDHAHGIDGARIGAGAHASDSIRWQPVALVEKWDADQLRYVQARSGLLTPAADDFHAAGVRPYETVEAVGNLLTTAGLNRLTSLAIAAGGQAPTNTSARLGVGNSTTAATVGQTDLQAAAGSSNRQFKIMDATYPTQSNGVLTFKSTFPTTEANFAWDEWCVDIGTPTVADGTTVNALMLNRKVQALGTKTSAGTWALTATVTIS